MGRPALVLVLVLHPPSHLSLSYCMQMYNIVFICLCQHSYISYIHMSLHADAQ